jgi:XRE family transcriptional regulator, regulator of sulfur utilization
MPTAAFPGVAERLARSVRVHRVARGLSLGELARRSGLSKTSLANVESGAGNPSLETLWRIAGALDLPLGELLGEGEPPETRLVRAGEGAPLESQSGLRGRMILAEGRAHRTEVLEAELAAGADYRAAPHAPGTEELVVCVTGVASVGRMGDEHLLNEGDSLRFPADGPHRYASAEGARVLVVMSYPSATAHEGPQRTRGRSR